MADVAVQREYSSVDGMAYACEHCHAWVWAHQIVRRIQSTTGHAAVEIWPAGVRCMCVPGGMEMRRVPLSEARAGQRL